MTDIRFSTDEIKKYFSPVTLNSFLPTREKRGVIAATLFKRPYHSSELNGREGVSVGPIHVLDLLCCEVLVGYAFSAPSAMRTDVNRFIVNIRNKGSTNSVRDPQLKFRGANFNLYADRKSDDITILIDRANLVDVSVAN